MSNEKYSDLIEIMAIHEEALSEFYIAAGDRFSNKELWKFLASEETKHAMWLRSVLDNVLEGSVQFNSKALSLKLYTDSISKISSEKTAINGGKRKLSQVFEFAVNIENEMIEKNFLDGFVSPFKGIQITLANLKKDTEEHKKHLEKAYAEFRRQKQKYLDDKKSGSLDSQKLQPIANIEPQKKEQAIQDRPDIKKMSSLKKKQDEITSFLEEDDEKWIEEYKKMISSLDPGRSEMKTPAESCQTKIASFEEKKVKLAEKIKKDSEENEAKGVDFRIYHYIGLHSEYERQLSNLYKLFQNIFPNDELWPFMTEEERKHEYWLKEIILKFKEGTIIFKMPKYDMDIVLKAIINISEMILFCKEFKISHKEAYQIAFDQEKSMLEDGFFRNFSSDAPALDKVCKMLLEDTLEHKLWLKKRMDFYNY